MKRVIIESPYSVNTDTNIAYVRACMADCLRRGEAPYASHALYTQPGVLRDWVEKERKSGIDAGFAWHKSADKVVLYTDLGISEGMEAGRRNASKLQIPWEQRQLGSDWFTYGQSIGSWGPISIWSDPYYAATMFFINHKQELPEGSHRLSEVPPAIRAINQQEMKTHIDAYWRGENEDDIVRMAMALGHLILAAVRILILYGIPIRGLFAQLYEKASSGVSVSRAAASQMLEEMTGRSL